MAIKLEEIERGYAHAMHERYSRRLKSFDEVFSGERLNRGGMHVVISAQGSITLNPGFGPSGSHNLSNRDAASILNIIRMSITERKQKFEQDERK